MDARSSSDEPVASTSVKVPELRQTSYHATSAELCEDRQLKCLRQTRKRPARVWARKHAFITTRDSTRIGRCSSLSGAVEDFGSSSHHHQFLRLPLSARRAQFQPERPTSGRGLVFEIVGLAHRDDLLCGLRLAAIRRKRHAILRERPPCDGTFGRLKGDQQCVAGCDVDQTDAMTHGGFPDGLRIGFSVEHRERPDIWTSTADDEDVIDRGIVRSPTDPEPASHRRDRTPAVGSRADGCDR